MKDEIKEILDYFRKYMSIKDCIKLSKIEDYITNLQQIEQEHQKLNGELREENNKLQEENEDLKIDNKRLQHNEKVFKSRNEKAIELVKKIDNFDINADKCWNDLLTVLQGEDKDVKD